MPQLTPQPVAPTAAPIGYSSGNFASAGPQKTSGLAISALVCGILALILPPLGIVAIILGIIALTKTKDPAVGGKGMAIAGISVGAAGMLVSACLISILLPSLNRARETANRVKCASNMRQIGMAMLLYANENNQAMPPDLKAVLTTQDLGTNVACCPSSNETAAASATAFNPQVNSSYTYIVVNQSFRQVPPDAVVLYEPLTNHGGDGMNVLFGDGHVEFFTKQQAQRMTTQLQSGQNPPR